MKKLLLLLSLTLLSNLAAGTFTVTNTSDDSLTVGSLRWAIGEANANAGPDTILFDPSLSGMTIAVQDSSLPAITDDFLLIRGDIDGDFIPDITLEQQAVIQLIGLELQSSNNRIEYLRLQFFTAPASAIYINGGSDNVIIGCHLEANEHGVHVANGGRRNRIGDGTIAGRNYFVGGNNEGIRIESVGSDSNEVRGNFIGVTSSNTASGNGLGIVIAGGAKYNRIGDGTSNGRNIIAASSAKGIQIIDAGTKYNRISGNYVGTDAAGSAQSGFENQQEGISVNDGAGNVIGGTTAGERNIIANNQGEGIYIFQADSTEVLGNYVGLDVSGNAAGNAFGGITIQNSDIVKIGDGTVAGRNVIGSNTFNGIWIQANGGQAFGNSIEGNYIGVGPNGVSSRANSQHGIRIYANTDFASANKVADNVIAYNNNYGIEIEGNGVPADQNFIFRNSIFNNGSGGISHIAMAQNSIGQVVSVFADIGTKIVSGTASAQDNLVQIYADYGSQGRIFLDTVYAGVGGLFSKVIPEVAPNLNITALQSDALGNTSIFSTAFSTPINKLIVTRGSDDGSIGTLRAAIDSANANTGPDTIRFANPLMLGQTIEITGSILSFNGNGNVIDGDVDGDFKPSVSIVDGGSPNWALQLAGSYNVVRYLNFQKFNVAAIIINGSKYNRIEGCYIGTSLDGMSASGTGNFWGIQIANNGVGSNIIGDSISINGRNVISGNSSEAISFQNDADSNYVVGNYIGLNAAGTAALPNGFGIGLGSVTTKNFIGSTGPNGRNVISGNNGVGLVINGDTCTVTNNIIGLDATGTFAIPNLYEGIVVSSTSSGNRIGGTSPGERNIISGSGDEGIELAGTGHVVLGNYIGTDITGTTAIANQIGIGMFGKNNRIGDGTTTGANVISGNTIYGIYFQGSDSNALQRNFIGVTATGDMALANLTDGILLDGPSNTVSGNVISGNGAKGVTIVGRANIVTGNFIGTDTTGQLDLGNTNEGIRVEGGSSLDSIASNVIAFNQNGIITDGSTTDSNRIHQNLFLRNDFSGIVIIGLSQQNVAPPRITNIAPDSTVSGTAAPNAFIQLYADSMDYNNQGRYFLGTTNADGSGFWSRKVVVVPGTEIKALQDSALNTSAFSTPVIPFFGTLAVTPSTLLDFGTVVIGDSTVLSFQVFPVGGNVRIDSVTEEPYLPFRLLADNIDPPHDLIENQDSLFATFSFVPTAEGTFADTVYFYSALDTLELIFTGVGTLNVGTLTSGVASVGFGSVRLGDSASAIVALYTGTGPVIISQTQIGTSNFRVAPTSFPDTLAAGTDTLELTVRFVPQAVGLLRDTLRILSNSLGGTLSIPFVGTALENVPPVLDIYVVRSTVIKKYVDVVVTGNEGLTSVNGTLTLGTPTNVSLSPVGGSSRVFGVPFTLAVGTLNIAVTGTDSAGNSAVQNRSYAVGVLEKGSLTLRHGNVELVAPKKAFDDGTYILLGSKAPAKAPSLSKTGAGWVEIGGRIDVMATDNLRDGERLTLRVAYDGTQLTEVRRQPDFDERRIGLYQWQNGQWQYLGGEGANGSVQGYVREWGEVALFYNPDHVFLPKSVELSQNYPNPFNPSTTIRFGLPEEGRIRLTVYNMLGQRVAELFNGFARAGFHTVTWQGLNEAGHRATSGVYIYRLETPNGLATRKMLLIK
jgi:parallel beta-helix repeat protein